MKRVFLTLFAFLSLMFGSVASAALTAPDFTGATTDVTTVVVAVIAFLVTIFGFKKVMGLIGR